VKVLLAEDTAVVASIVDTSWNIGEQRLTMKTCHSDTYVRRSDRWRLLATHMAIVNSPPPKATVIKLDPKLLDEYAGVYQLGQAIRLKVYRKGDKLSCRCLTWAAMRATSLARWHIVVRV
jgi:hypothetical protein